MNSLIRVALGAAMAVLVGCASTGNETRNAGIEGTGKQEQVAGIEGTGSPDRVAGIEGTGKEEKVAGIEGTGKEEKVAGIEGTGKEEKVAGIEGTGKEEKVAGIEGTGTPRHIVASGEVTALGSIVVGFASVFLLDFAVGLDLDLNHRIALGLVLPIVILFGDLGESAIKRAVGVKDSSNIVPGHGGVADRIDSLLFAVPFVYWYINWVIL